MKRVSILACVVGVCFVATAWAEQPGVAVSRSFNAPARARHAKIWELGTYPGGTWFATWRINDLGVVVGRGDVPPVGADGVGDTHTLAVPLFGERAGEWIDLGTLGGEEPKGREEPFADISNTGLVVSHSTAPDGWAHGVAWTRETGMVDLGTLADTGDPRYASYNTSYAMATNKLGTLIAGMSGVDETPWLAPVIWTPAKVRMNGRSVTRWKIRKLATATLPDLTGWDVWGVNNRGQILGSAYDAGFTTVVGVLWNPRPDGRGWGEPISLPALPFYPLTNAYGINDKGEIVGAAISPDTGIWLSVLWQPLDKKRTTYSPAIALPLPAGFTSCDCVGLNELGDLVGDCWNDVEDRPARWTTKDLTFAEIIGFPGTWGFSWGVNNNRIAAVTYSGGENCPLDWCGGAIHLR
jgi:uncharacterized membrane protein